MSQRWSVNLLMVEQEQEEDEEVEGCSVSCLLPLCPLQ